MKCLWSVIACCTLAWPQMKTGSVAVYLSSQNDIIVAADSRIVSGKTGRHNDMECKLRTFGDKFFFVSAGVASQQDARTPTWSAKIDARNAWEEASKLSMVSSAQTLAHETATRWTTVMETHFDNPGAISALRPMFEGGPTIESAVFGDTNATELAATKVVIGVDLQRFDSEHVVRLWHKIEDVRLGDGGTIGLGEVANEYYLQTTPRAKQFMTPYLKRLPPVSRNVELAKKLVELSVKLHPRSAYLGLPVDELTLERGKGIRWLHVKPNCSK